MKSITEIIGGAQILFDISFDIQDSFEEYLTTKYSLPFPRSISSAAVLPVVAQSILFCTF
ncbi:hypothetical protein SAMN05920897_1203 [Alkalispirochaeta americana]|uniref:Uncharacterized protein n=1 Tax=Alkalispirochaeta americana TaxID=159291 RepID=A0A1N6X2M6_9SPIO|nr:hypothetical protein SAMN05920897_1203 [Alkalispirochaeta americana]